MIAAVGRQCTRCRQYKMADEFDRASNRVGLSVRCKACRLEMGVTAPCKRCGKVYVVKGGNGYCSAQCWYEAKRNQVEVPCVGCGKAVLRHPDWANGDRLAFCSNECQGQHVLSEQAKKKRCRVCGDACRWSNIQGWNKTCGKAECLNAIVIASRSIEDESWYAVVALQKARLIRKTVPVDPWRTRCMSAATSLRKRAAGLSSHASGKDLYALLEKQGYECALTGRPLTPEQAVCDHAVPCSRGGMHDIGNIQWIDAKVNKAKGEMTNDEFIEMCRSVASHSDMPKL